MSNETLICRECGHVLTDEERTYYHSRCEQCERDWSDRITAWRKGGDDPALDELYDGKPVRH